MKFLITGATGFIGQHLVKELFKQGHDQIHVLTRNKDKAQEKFSLPIKAFNWDPTKGIIDQDAFSGVDIVIHLAGEGVADGRWTEKRKEAILNSRVKGTSLLIDTIKDLAQKPKKLISASAIGIYGNRGVERLDSSSTHGDDFLADICKRWEAETHNHNIENFQTHSIRVGIVLGLEGGALKQMLPPFQAGVAGNLGNGQQFMSWIHVKDLVSQFIFLANTSTTEKYFNGTAPNPVTNKKFTKTLGGVLGRPTLFPVPTFALKVIFGEMSQILTNSQNIHCEQFTKLGFKFSFPDLEGALQDLLQYLVKGQYQLDAYHWLPKNKADVFPFFSNEKNLEKITPPFLKFNVLKKSTEKLEEGTILDYKLNVRGIPLFWRTRINEYVDNDYFIDEQIKGPYAKWLHTHRFYTTTSGTLMQDNVIYKVPLGILGRIFAGWFVRQDVKSIFEYRKQTLNKLLLQG